MDMTSTGLGLLSPRRVLMNASHAETIMFCCASCVTNGFYVEMKYNKRVWCMPSQPAHLFAAPAHA